MTAIGIQLMLDGQGIAVAAASKGHYRDHQTIIYQAVCSHAAAGQPFTIEHIRASVPADTKAWMKAHYNAPQAEITRAASRGLIRNIGHTKSSRPERKAGIIGIWQGRTA